MGINRVDGGKVHSLVKIWLLSLKYEGPYGTFSINFYFANSELIYLVMSQAAKLTIHF